MTNFFSPTSSPNQPTKPKGHTVQISTSDVDDEDDHDNTDVSGEVGSSKRNKFGLCICPRSSFAHDFEWFFNEYGETLGDNFGLKRMWIMTQHQVNQDKWRHQLHWT